MSEYNKEIWVQRGSFIDCIVKNRKGNQEWVKAPVKYIIYSEHEKLEQQLKEADSVIEFYANGSNYIPQDYKGLHYIKPIGDDYSPLSDTGMVARKYLTKYKRS